MRLDRHGQLADALSLFAPRCGPRIVRGAQALRGKTRDGKTVCRRGLRLAEVFFDVVDRQLHSGNRLGFFIRDFGFELFFQRHNELNRIQ